jgi:phosphoribosylglycinamide formyltransferase-1
MRIALLISGGGSTMEAIIKATQNGTLVNVVPALIIASNINVNGINKAKELGISINDIVILDPKLFSNEELFGDSIIFECKKRNVDFIGQYGWMVKTPKNVCDAFYGMIANQHPGPLDTGRPDFGGTGMYGLRVHQARLEFVNKVNRDFWTEATAHRVTANFDEGVVLKRKKVVILENDTAEILKERVLPIEHEVQIELLKDFSENKVEELKREIPLILQGEEGILLECKENAINMYPKG